jgi:histidinol dehydrogenase
VAKPAAGEQDTGWRMMHDREQAEHDVEARPILICTSDALIKAVDSEVSMN